MVLRSPAHPGPSRHERGRRTAPAGLDEAIDGRVEQPLPNENEMSGNNAYEFVMSTKKEDTPSLKGKDNDNNSLQGGGKTDNQE